MNPAPAPSVAPASPVAPLALPLSDPRARDASLTGSKASRLSALRDAGHPVPEGFVLTTAAFDVRGPEATLLPEARRALSAALDALGGRVAVRSSGVAEDLPDQSFAGQYETVLDVAGVAAVEAAVARCLASARSPRVEAYRAKHGLGPAPLAVLVQRFVPARAAGVAFTAHPVTGERGVVVLSAVRGVGESLVSGETDAEEWEVREAPRRHRCTDPVLEEGEAAAVAALARAVEPEVPTDIEWAITRDGDGPAALHLLQARPMTAVPEPVAWQTSHPGAYIRNFRLGEWIGAPVTPLFESWVIDGLERGMHRQWTVLMGLVPPSPLHTVINGWYFYGGMNYDLGAGAMLRSLPTLVPALLDRRKRAQILAGIPPLAYLGFDAELARWRTELLPALRAIVERAEASVEGASPAELVATVQSIVDESSAHLSSIVGVAGYAAKAEGKLFRQFKKLLPGLDVSPIELVAGAEVTPAPHDVEGLDPVFPTLGERGALPPPPTGEARERVRRRRDAAEQRVLAALPERRRAEMKSLVAEARRAHAARIEQTGMFTLGWPVMRRAMLRLGGFLAERGVIPEAGDVFFVTRPELDRAVAGDRGPVPVAERRAAWQRQRRLSPPLLVGAMPDQVKKAFDEFFSLLHHEEHDAADALPGMPGSPGRVTGVARVVRSVDELDRLAPGEILVAPVTTPAWTLAFERALAVVTDSGSVASHASVVAREYGLPAVVGTATATSRIVDGQRITVDGGRGVVRLAPR